MSDVLLGRIVDGRHRIECVSGRGGFATVYRGIDVQSGRVVAIKVLHEELRDSARSRARFDRETEAVAKLASAHTVGLISNGEFDGVPYIIFEFVDGTDLAEVLEERGRLDGDVVLHVLRQVLESLHEAHGAGIIHRDLKPENIRLFTHLDDPWFVKVLDFGVARMAAPQGGNLTQTGEIIGTPRYMSPEQLLGEDPDPSSDIYSLGLVAIELLLGRASLQGNRWADQFSRLESGHFFAPAGIANAQLVAVLQRMTARDAKSRYQRVVEVLAALDDLSENRTLDRTVDEAELAPTAIDPATLDNAYPAEPERTLDTRRDLSSTTEEFSPMWRRRPQAPELAADVTPEPKPENVSLTLIALTGLVSLIVVGGVLFGVTGLNDDDLTAESQSGASPVVDAGRGDDAGESNNAPRHSDGCGRPGWQGRSFFPFPYNRRAGLMAVLPDGYDSNHAYPLVLIIGASGQLASQVLRLSGAEQVARQKGFIAAAVDAVRTNNLSATESTLYRLSQRACVDMRRVFLIGHRQGGRILRQLACEFPIAGMATIGHREERGACRPDPPVPHIRFNGSDDPYDPESGNASCALRRLPDLATVLERTLDSHGCSRPPIPWKERDDGRCEMWTCAAAPVATCQMQGGAEWNVKTDAHTRCQAEPPTFPVMETIWEFFAQQPSSKR